MLVSSNVRKRRIVASFWWTASVAACVLILAVLTLIFVFVIVQGVPALLRGATYVTVTSGVAGGLANAIAGTALLVAFGAIIATLLGVSTGIFTAEYAPTRMKQGLRYIVDVLAGVPSIVVGYFGYIALVIGWGWHFSLLAGAIALAIIMLPYVVRSTDVAFSAVPTAMREGAYALGATKSVVVRTISAPYALPGTLTGLLIGGGIALGETAPLIYTAGWSNYLPTLQLTHNPVGYLTYVVWTFIGEPFESAHQLAYGAAVLLMISVFFVNVVARILIDRYARRVRGERSAPA